MTKRSSIVAFVATAWLLASTVRAQAQGTIPMPSEGVGWVLALMCVFFVIMLFAVLAGLSRGTWALQDALSEEAELAVPDKFDAAGQPIKATKLVASSSRLIALLGLMGILSLFMACGAILLWDVAKGNSITAQADAFAKYLFYGMVMFAPYVVNKFSAIFEKFGPPRG